MKLTSASEDDNRAAAQFLQEKIGKVDVVIACAGKSFVVFFSVCPPSTSGSSTGRATIASATLTQLRSDFEINTIGPIVLFQAFESLLSASDALGGAKFIIVSSVLGQITEASDYSYDAYGISKAGANFVAKKLSQEIPGLISFPMQYVIFEHS